MTDVVPPPLAVSLGDPAGVGPELICEAWARRDAERLPAFFVCGGAGLLQRAADLRGIKIVAEIIEQPAGAIDIFGRALPVVGTDDGAYRPGVPDGDGAALAFRSLKLATSFAVEGAASAVVTAPIAKAQLAAAGFVFPGQTEFMADATGLGADSAVMMLAGPQLRTVPITVHCPLAEVPARLTADLIYSRSRTVDAALQQDFGIENPRLAIAALNPHAGEEGRMGTEDREVVAPAIARLRAEGIDATGPHPADTLFAPRARATYDVAIAMYHDQALIPLKALDFDQGVNVTLGLPIVRTSPDHGTAFDIAGKGIADPGAMIAAIRMAGEIAARRARA
ncbi:MAG: 4-hydroxythreonine-4-phosphate dehydrogenase PdxA [Croceibacterium sp.]